MADEADMAQARMEIEEGLIKKVMRSDVERLRSDDCIDCGDIIPEARQMVTGGTERCVDCQGYFERRRQHGR